MRSLAARGVLALVVLAALLAAGGAAQDDGPAEPAETMRVALDPDGDAHWTVTVRFDLDSQSEIDGFDRMAAEFEEGESDDLTVEPFREAARQASDSTGRSMEVGDVERRAVRSNDTGRLELSFTWTAFARQSDDQLHLGDVFQTEPEPWLSGLDRDQELVVVFPREYSVVNSSHNLDNRAFDIRGPTSFDSGLPSATLVRDDDLSPTTIVTTESPTTGTNGSTDPGPSGTWQVLGVGALAVMVGVLALLVERRRRSDGGTFPDGDDGGPPAATEAAVRDGADDGDESTEDPGVDEELLSDDERVLRLLYDNDGRMKQARIVEETGWSNAKVSQLLSEMAENGQVDKLRIGRENLISLPDHGPDDGE